MANPGYQERTIQEEAKECRSLLTDIMIHLTRYDPFSIGTDLQDELGRFNLWAGNIGVFALLQASLDFRLIDVPDISAQFLRQLDTLNITLMQLNEAAAQTTTEENEDPPNEDSTRLADRSILSDHDIVELVQSVHVTIDWLHRLSNLVRKASFGSQNERAARFPLADEAGNDITESLVKVFEHLIKRECCDISDKILNRLSQTMITRRRRVLYRRSRQKRWALQQEAYRPRHIDPLTQLAPLQEADESGDYHEDSFNPENRVQASPSRLTATTLDQQKFRKLAAPSQISRATTAPFQLNEKLLVPPRPLLAKGETDFVCDYCCLILPSSEAADQDTWANHVTKDLDPYICVFDDCSQPYQIYSSSKEWLSHIRSEHRISWRCVVRDHPPQTFETREAFIDHMTQAHSGMFRKEQLPFIAESSARALSPTVPVCPFCAEDSGDLENHVAQHLCHFALQSLPWPDHLDQASEITSGREISSSTSEDVERATLGDLDDGLSFIDIEWTHSRLFDMDPGPLLDAPVSWPDIERIFPEPDPVLSDLAAQAARRAAMAPNDIHGEPETLDEEIRRVMKQVPDVKWTEIDMATPKFRASLRGPWGFEGEHIMLNVKVTVPHAYPEAQAPSFLVEEHEGMPELVREELQREVHEICQLHLLQKKTCLAAAFSYLLGVRDATSSINMFNVEMDHVVPLGDVDENKLPASPFLRPDGMESAKVAGNNDLTVPEKTEAQPTQVNRNAAMTKFAMGIPYDPRDAYIVVMGITGSGKSTFISRLCGGGPKIGHGLESCTSEIEVFSFKCDGRTVHLIDTLSFNDTHRTDSDVLKDLVFWLDASYHQQIRLSGMVYLHPIHEKRITGASRKNMKIFRQLCGDSNLQSVVLATTMWEASTNESMGREFEDRQEQLKLNPDFWGEMASHGSLVLRHNDNIDSALKIIRYILNQNSRITLQVQREMEEDNKRLDQTLAGEELSRWLLEQQRLFEKRLQGTQVDMEDAIKNSNKRVVQELAKQQDELQKQLELAMKESEQLKLNMEEIVEEKESEAVVVVGEAAASRCNVM